MHSSQSNVNCKLYNCLAFILPYLFSAYSSQIVHVFFSKQREEEKEGEGSEG